jgi:trehalose 6-phosphate phosphatase
LDLLQRLAVEPRFGLFSDLDGTLAPIAPSPQAANISPRARHLLAELRDVLPLVALISGRRADSLQAKVGVPGLVYVGNHGLEQWADGKTTVLPEVEPYLAAMQAAKRELSALEEPGAFVEDKEATLSFHFRQVEDQTRFAKTREKDVEKIANNLGLGFFGGKMVFEVRPPILMDKGLALQNMTMDHSLKAALFLGDDVTDLAGLAMVRMLRNENVCDAWGVGVQSSDAPAVLADTADFLAADVSDVEELLSWLLSARKASST